MGVIGRDDTPFPCSQEGGCGVAPSLDGEIPPTECDPCTTTHVTPRWLLTKSSDPASGSTVVPGETITYTLAAENISEAVLKGVSATDDLSGVLPYAELTGSLPAGVSLTGTTLTWAVPALQPGQIATVSYSLTLTDASIGATLTNVAVPGDPSGDCPIDMPASSRLSAAAWDRSLLLDLSRGAAVDAREVEQSALGMNDRSGERRRVHARRGQHVGGRGLRRVGT